MREPVAALLRPAWISAIIPALVFVIISALTHSASPAALVVEDCACEAPDGSCSANISCKGGCIRFCGNDGDCYAECSDKPGDGTETTVEIHNGTYSQLVAELTRIGGKKVEFTPREPKAKLNISLKRAALWDALEYLSDRGTLRVEGRDFESLRGLRKVLLSGGRTPFSVKNRPVNAFVQDIAFLTGLPLRIVGGRPYAPVNIELRNATLEEILRQASRQTGVKIREDGT